MKIVELQKVPVEKIGRFNKNGIKLYPHEESTAVHLAQFGIDVEAVKPRHAKGSSNADIFMMGAIWEIKSPITFNKSTIKEDFRKASSQSERIIFDLRRVKAHADDVKKQIIEIFKGKGSVRRLIIIEKNEKTFEFFK